MTGRRDEIESFKTAIDLRAFAADAHSYELEPKASSPNSSLMRCSHSGDKIIVARGRDGHFIYFSTSDTTDCGSIIDFAQKRGVGNIGQVRKALRPYLGRSPEIALRSSFTKLQPVERDIAAVRAQWLGMDVLEDGRHPYLNVQRQISPEVLAHPRFAGRVQRDARGGNAAFAHLDTSGEVVGFELRNERFAGFAKSGRKTAFVSRIHDTDEALVLCEAAIDALSYAQLFGLEHSRFMSLGGQVSPEQRALVQAAIVKLPQGTVILASDNDTAGDRLVDTFTELFEAVGREDIGLQVHRPETRGADWNNVLRDRSSSPPPPEPII